MCPTVILHFIPLRQGPSQNLKLRRWPDSSRALSPLTTILWLQELSHRTGLFTWVLDVWTEVLMLAPISTLPYYIISPNPVGFSKLSFLENCLCADQFLTNPDSPGRKIPLQNCLHQTSSWARLWSIILIAKWCGRTEPTVGSAIPGYAMLGSIRKVGKQVRRDNFPWSLLQFLNPRSCLEFLPSLLLRTTFNHSSFKLSSSVLYCSNNEVN